MYIKTYSCSLLVFIMQLIPIFREIVNKWSDMLGFEDPEFSVINFLATTDRQLKWNADGLPQDNSALKNAVIIDQVLYSSFCMEYL